MNLTRTVVTIACFVLFVTEGIAGDTHPFAPRFVAEPRAGITVSAASDTPAGFQATGSMNIGMGMDIPPSFGAEIYAGISGTTASRITSPVYYTGFSGAGGGFDVIWKVDDAWGVSIGPRVSWMRLSITDHAFFYPSAALGTYLAFSPAEDASWYLRLHLRHTHHFRKDLAYVSTTSIGISMVQPWEM